MVVHSEGFLRDPVHGRGRIEREEATGVGRWVGGRGRERVSGGREGEREKEGREGEGVRETRKERKDGGREGGSE